MQVLALFFALIAFSLAGCTREVDTSASRDQEHLPSEAQEESIAKNMEAAVSRSFASRMDLPDGSYIYVIQLHIRMGGRICVPEIAQGNYLSAMGSFVMGRREMQSEFLFAPSEAAQIANIDTVSIDPDAAYFEISFRSNLEADELSAEVPYIQCKTATRLDWDTQEHGMLTTGWLSLS